MPHSSDHDDHHAADGDAVCPVCLMTVDSHTAPARDHDGETWSFCNDRCVRAFDKHPDHFAARARAAAEERWTEIDRRGASSS